MAKLVLDYSHAGDTVFAMKTHGIVQGLTGNPAFAPPWPPEFPTLAALTALQNEFALAVAAAADRDKAKVAAKNALRAELQAMVRELGRYVQTRSGGNLAILEGTGFDLARERRRKPGIPGAPQKFRIASGPLPGSVRCSAEAPEGSLAFEIQHCAGDPAVAADWTTDALCGRCRKVEVAGLERGKDTAFRIRAIGKEGPGPWSTVAIFMPH